MRLSDEELMAYVDGEPGSANAAIVEKQRTGFSAEEAGLLEEYHRTRDLVRAAFGEDEREPLPTGLVAMILGHERRDVGVGGSKIVPMRRAGFIRTFGAGALALAASIALAIGVSSWRSGVQRSDLAEGFIAGPLPAGSVLTQVLERKPAGHPVDLPIVTGSPYAHLMIAGTFRDRNARICREVELLDPLLAPRMVAVACRASAKGAWSVEGTAVVSEKSAGSENAIAPAGAPEPDALGALLTMLGAKSILSPDEERQLLDNGWK